MNLKYFDLHEFDSPDEPGSGKEHMNKEFVKMLDEARYRAGVPFIVTSGYRSDEYNKQVGGVNDSAHTKGLAVDIACPVHNEMDILKGIVTAGFTRIGLSQDDQFIHVDIDPDKPDNRWWTY